MASELHLIFGENEHQVGAKAKEISEALVPPEERILGLDIIDGMCETAESALSALARCAESLQTRGFLGGRKVVWLKDVNFLQDNKQGRSDDVKSSLARLIEIVKKGTDSDPVLLVSARKADKRHAFYKACGTTGKVIEFAKSDKPYISEREASECLVSVCSRLGLRMEPDARGAFLAKVGTDERQIIGEAEKLKVYLGDGDTAGMKDVDAVTSTSRENVVWDLTGALSERDLKKAVTVLRRLLYQKENPIGLLMRIQQEVRDIMLFREAIDRKWLLVSKRGERISCEWGKLPPEVDMAFSESFSRDPRKMHPYKASILAKCARNFSPSEFKLALEKIRDAHIKLVTSSMPDSIVMELLLVDIISCSHGKSRATA